MAAQITDEHLQVFTAEASWDGLADELIARYGDIASRLVLYNAGRNLDRFDRYGQVAQQIIQRTS